ncbi:MAG: PadR family transcriptional regulator [Candidatus Heimdallarchaeota archaeon]|nr:PadR family transcriptional regulator [Candidatus Heimdallarchaeota archaeon]MCK4290509.1 PadR family transcriptional regulator [Candidatus Heimdallarchaeota archaeon]
MWILDVVSGVGKTSSIQVAILMEFAKSKDNPKKVTEIIAALKDSFTGYWEPKKGTIYPSVHNLHVRGYLKLHAVKPYGYSIAEKGLEAIDKIFSNINLQMEAYMQYYSFLLNNYNQIDQKKAKETTTQIVKSISEYIKQMNALNDK